jgi:hypothetical protein
MMYILCKWVLDKIPKLLVRVCESAHAAHHTQHVVVQGIHAHLGRAGTNHRVQGHRQLERGLVDTREVARAARLVLLRAQSERVHVDTRARRARVVLERLHLVEVATLTLREAVLAVQLQLGHLHWVLALAADAGVQDHLGEQVVHTGLELTRTRYVVRISAIHARRSGRTGRLLRGTLTQVGRGIGGSRALGRNRTSLRLRQQRRDHTIRAEVIGVVERLGTTNRRQPGGRRAVNERVALHHPEELLHGVVKVQLDLVAGRRDALSARVLHLLDEVLVALLGEAAALLRVQVDVVHIQRGSGQRLGRGSRGGTNNALGVLAVLPRLEVHVHAHLVVLEGNQRDGHTRVTAEPELQRDVQRLGGRAGAGHARDGRLGGRARRIQTDTSAALHQHQGVRVADQGVQGLHRTGLLGQLRPDLHPVTILAVNALATDLNLHLLDEAVADVVQPAETSRARQSHLRQHNLHVRLVHQVGVTVDDGRHALVEVGLAVERHLNGLHSEVRVALVEDLPERNLGVTRDVNILGAVRNKLHKTRNSMT